MANLSCVVAAPHDVTREGLAALLSNLRPRIAVRQVATVGQLFEVCQALSPGLLVLDSRISSPRGTTAVGLVRARLPHTRILTLVRNAGQACAHAVEPSHDPDRASPCCPEADCMGRALADGADAVVLTSAIREEIRCTAQALLDDGRRVRESVLGRQRTCARREGPYDFGQRLTPREWQIVRLLQEGLCNKEIASRLGIQVATVKKHIGSVLIKLRLRDRLQIALLFEGGPMQRNPVEGLAAPTGASYRTRPTTHRS